MSVGDLSEDLHNYTSPDRALTQSLNRSPVAEVGCEVGTDPRPLQPNREFRSISARFKLGSLLTKHKKAQSTSYPGLYAWRKFSMYVFMCMYINAFSTAKPSWMLREPKASSSVFQIVVGWKTSLLKLFACVSVWLMEVFCKRDVTDSCDHRVVDGAEVMTQTSLSSGTHSTGPWLYSGIWEVDPLLDLLLVFPGAGNCRLNQQKLSFTA